jgi:hypothetical protein
MARLRTLTEVIQENLARKRQFDAKPTTIGDPAVLCKTSAIGQPIDRNIPAAGTGQILVTSTPQQVSYVNRTKLSTLLTMVSVGVDVYWGTNPTVTPFVSNTQLGSGSLLVGIKGAWVSIIQAAVIFVVCASGSTAVITWSEAYDD